MSIIGAGNIRKMRTELSSPVAYFLPVGDAEIALQEYIGSPMQLRYTGLINCIHCQRKTNKSFNQGYCYPCFKRLAQCDTCIIKPEQCHYFAGTCREPEWGDEHCMRDHFVYLANSSGLKVGITRGNQVPTRWMDQGAIQALPIFRVANRQQSGMVEVLLKQLVADKTNWRAMLKGEVESLDLAAQRDALFTSLASEIVALQERFGLNDIQMLTDAEAIEINYPVIQYPTKVTSLNFDKTPVVAGELQGIKGQYLILDSGVINLRKFAGYHVEVSSL